MAYHEMLPPEVLALQQELKHWPIISAEAQKTGSIEECLGTIAARLGILLDGMYTVPELCDMLVRKLQELRTTTIYVPDKSMQEIRIKEGANEVVIENVPDINVTLPGQSQSPKKED